ncbi:histidine phosphatase family protein [Candidatus Woesebacteria bacterium]|nr:histidine phosphatase family protein [Candidatus Woesebacteria bacterium]
MRKIYLVRHAQYSNPRNILVGRLPVELSQEGKQEASDLADYFSDKEIFKIYSSSVLRCKQTSEIISKNQIEIKYDTRILETFSAMQGYWEFDWLHFFNNIDTLGGETPEDISKRMLDFWDDIISSENDKNIIICSHGDPLYVLYAHLADIALPSIKGLYEIPKVDYQEKASVRTIEIDNFGKLFIKPTLTINNIRELQK